VTRSGVCSWCVADHQRELAEEPEPSAYGVAYDPGRREWAAGIDWRPAVPVEVRVDHDVLAVRLLTGRGNEFGRSLRAVATK
jgi:hypothetical protein